jgi:hypothetical protein|tara:strand:- start:495 stop:938 length:444 start_codon:yes stop_codon:yes gene_type:complete
MVERRTQAGKLLDMEVLMAENETTIAVGNAKVNARGDQLGAGGVVVKTANEVAIAYYQENPRAVITQSIKEELGVTQQSTLQADTLVADAPTEKQAFDDWVDPENTVETPTGKVTTEKDRVVASGTAKPAPKQKAKAKAKDIDELYK